MKKLLVVIFSILPFLLFAQTSIYDIQYTTEAGDGTYPSLHVGDIVSTGGIVSVTNYRDGRYFISSSNGGAWNGLFIYNNTNSPSVGDSIIITGEVVEYKGMTEISNLSAYNVISSSNSLPANTSITTAQVTDEAYEGVLVEITDCSVSGEYDNNGNWKTDDGSGECIVQSVLFNLENEEFPLLMGYPFSSVKGIVTDYYGASLFPRYVEDIQSDPDAFVLISENKYVVGDLSFMQPINVALLNQSTSITSYVLNLTYDASIFTYNGYEKTGTLSEPGTITDNSTEGNISLSFTGSITCDDILTLVKLQFTPIDEGDGNLQFAAPTINGSEITYLSMGSFLSGLTECDEPKADTLTVVQRPLLNNTD